MSLVLFFAVALLGLPRYGLADALCARVKIQINQKLAFERQAFDAEMQINNGLDTTSLDNVQVNVNFQDGTGNTVKASSDPNDTSASFFIRVSSMTDIADVSGNGTVAPSTTADIHWLIIPAPGAGGSVPAGQLYLIGATLTYTLGGSSQTVQVTPDSVYVKPLPLMALDYFLTRNVYADDPSTPQIEPPVPFTLGVRIKNNGLAAAQGVKIDSAQPKIVQNDQGLLIDFKILGSYLNDKSVTNSLLMNFGNIPPNGVAVGRWLMTTTLSGKFVDFTATFSHSDALGGVLTSILQQVDTHLLVHDVKVDLPGRDNIRDFLARDGDTLRVYESDGMDTVATDQSAQSSFTQVAGTAGYNLSAPATSGFMYVSLPDPFLGTKSVGQVVRADGKVLAPENVWFSKTQNSDLSWNYFINFFDVNYPGGGYWVSLGALAGVPPVPVLQFIPDHVVTEGTQVSFLVQASDPDGSTPKLSAAPLPAGASFVDQGNGAGYLDWTPAVGQAGKYTITYTATNGTLTTSQSAAITVAPATKPGGPGIPEIDAPQVNTMATTLQPTFTVRSPNPLDAAQSYAFELYADAALTQLVASQAGIAKAGETTTWTSPQQLLDNTRYYWRVRSYDGTTYSPWANGRFTVNTANDAPGSFSIASPRSGAEVGNLSPTLSVVNSVDPDDEPVTYGFQVFADPALTQPVASAATIPAGANGSTSWTVNTTLSDQTRYYWRAVATDPHGAQTVTAAGNFFTDTANHAPTAPVIQAPAVGATTAAYSADLTVANSTDAEGDPITYTFEIDTVDTFNSAAKRGSGPVAAGADSTVWTVSNLLEDTRYYWRVRASDGKADSAWTQGEFFVNVSNGAPSVPTLNNPDNGGWVDTLVPRFDLAPSTDPENDPITYQFEVYSDAGLTGLVAQGQSSSPVWLPGQPLADNTTYYWHARAQDGSGAKSAWSPVATFRVATAVEGPPSITLTSPAALVVPANGHVALNWEVRDPENAATVELYYDSVGQGAAGQPIVQDIKQDPTALGGSYSWDVSALPPGTYYVYGVVRNRRASGTRYAPGAVVISPPSPRGSVIVQPASLQATSESGTTARLQVVLGSAPAADVVIGVSSNNPNEGKVSPAVLTFTQSNWNVPQTVTVTGVNDCVVDGNVNYLVNTAKAVSADPDYMGVKGADLSYINYDTTIASNTVNLAVCNYALVSTVRVGLTTSRWTFTANLTNTGPDIAGATATLTSSAPYTTVSSGTVTFGPVTSGQTVTGTTVFSVVQDLRYQFDPTTLNWTIQPIQ